jgi:hypothetical protein
LSLSLYIYIKRRKREKARESERKREKARESKRKREKARGSKRKREEASESERNSSNCNRNNGSIFRSSCVKNGFVEWKKGKNKESRTFITKFIQNCFKSFALWLWAYANIEHEFSAAILKKFVKTKRYEYIYTLLKKSIKGKINYKKL